MLFALVASGLWPLTTLYAAGYMRGHHEVNQTRFFTFFAVAICGALGVAFARNMFTLFVMYEFLTLSTYPLVTHHGNDAAKRAGRIYLGVLFTTSVGLLLFGTVWTWVLCGTLDFTPGGVMAGRVDHALVPVLLGLFVFGTGKAAVMPFHRWLPAAMVAPTPVSALLHAVAVVKAGVFTVLKVVVYLFGIDFLAETGASVWLGYVAAFTILSASVIALTKDNLKARLAYSTISQLSYIVLGAALATGAGVLGGGMHIAMHAVGKITLFFCAGAIMVASHKKKISEMDGLGRVMPVTYFAFFIGSVSIIGLPPMGGSWSKWFLAMGAFDAGQIPLVITLMLSSLLSIGYLMPVVARGFFLPAKAGAHGEHHGEHHGDGHHGGGIHEAPLACVIPLSITAAGCLALFVFAEDIHALLLPIVGTP
jgi:multicomponent Na+:H+ antiporter subunit D